jgi:hypothetical protein
VRPEFFGGRLVGRNIDGMIYMFEEILREINQLTKPRAISIKIPLDAKGYYDRLCPNTECGGAFKVLFDDWRDKVSDVKAYCPFCRHEANSENWNTPEQAEYIRSAAMAEMTRLVQGALRRGVERTRPISIGNGPIKIGMSLEYSPGHIPAVVPAAATEELRQDFVCESCQCRYASLGASFFCPACGHNSATSSFNTTLDTVRMTIAAMGPLREAIERSAGPDAAREATRQLVEDQFARLVGAFERLNEALFDKLPAAAQYPSKGSVFQRIDDGSQLWLQACGKGYEAFLTTDELRKLKLYFQRRHVFSHRQGIVDQLYINKSGDATYAVGQRLVARDSDMLELVDLLKKLSDGIRTLVP